MPLDDSLLSIGFGQLAVLGVVGLALGWLTDRFVGSPVLGGLIAGLLLSASVSGQWLPDLHQRVFDGGYEAAQQLQDKQEELADQREALVATGVTDVAVDGFDEMAEQTLTPMREQVQTEQDRYASAFSMMAAVVLGAWLFCSGASVPIGRWRAHLRDAMPLALGCVLLVALLATVGGTLLGRMAAGAEAGRWFAGLLIICMAGALPMSLTLTRRSEDELDDRSAITAGTALVLTLIAWVVAALVLVPAEAVAPETVSMPVQAGDALTALVLIALAMFAVNPLLLRWPSPIGRAGVVMLFAGVSAIIVGLPGLLAALLAGLALGHRSETVSDTFLKAATPVAAAAIAMQVSYDGWSWWLLVVVLIAAGDGKAIGMWLLSKLFGGRTWTSAFEMGAALSIAGLMPVVLAYLLKQYGLIDEPLFAAAVVATIIIELVMRPMLRWVQPAQAIT
jgi:hypothetical protein